MAVNELADGLGWAIVEILDVSMPQLRITGRPSTGGMRRLSNFELCGGD